jgi:hypothetical protein
MQALLHHITKFSVAARYHKDFSLQDSRFWPQVIKLSLDIVIFSNKGLIMLLAARCRCRPISTYFALQDSTRSWLFVYVAAR